MEYDNYWIIQCPRPHCHNIQIAHAKINQAICTKCSKPYRVSLKKHFNRVLASAETIEEAKNKRTLLLQEQSVIKEPPFKVGEEKIVDTRAFYLCEECKNMLGPFDKATLLPNMQVCSFCKQTKIVYEIGKAEQVPRQPEPRIETELSDDEKAEGVSVNEAGYKVGRDGVVIED